MTYTGGEAGKDNPVTCPVVMVVYGNKKRSKPVVFAEDLAFSFRPATQEEFSIHVIHRFFATATSSDV